MIYALLAGIGIYPSAQISNLEGPEEDAYAISDLLRKHFPAENLDIKMLLGPGAKYQKIIDGFAHLMQAGPKDQALFFFSGHGSRSRTAPEFEHLSPDKMDETLVCFDSRQSANDLADKELAALLAQINQKCPHVVILLDCCHAGSMFRSPAKIKRVAPRNVPRPLDSYYGNWPAVADLELPKRQAVVLAACHQAEQANEHARLRRGVFTLALEAMFAQRIDFSYTEILAKIRNEVKAYDQSQSPQLEIYGGFDPQHLFLSSDLSQISSEFRVFHETGQPAGWRINTGLARGFRSLPAVIDLFDQNGVELGEIEIQQLGIEKSRIISTKELPLKPEEHYLAFPRKDEQTFLEIGIPQNFDPELLNDSKYARQSGVLFKKGECKYRVGSLGNENYQLFQTQPEKELGRLTGKSELKIALQQLAKWEHFADLELPTQNEGSSQIDFQLQVGPHGQTKPYAKNQLTLDFPTAETMERVELHFRNPSSTPLYLYIFYLNPDFSIQIKASETLPAKSGWATCLKQGFRLTEESPSTDWDRYKILVSTSEIDHWELIQPKIRFAELTRSTDQTFQSLRFDRWMSLDLDIFSLKSQDKPENPVFSTDRLRLLPHPALQGKICLRSLDAWAPARLTYLAAARFLHGLGLQAIALSGLPENCILELSRLDNLHNWADRPLLIEWSGRTWPDKDIWALAWDGQEIFVPGPAMKENILSISSILTKGKSTRLLEKGTDLNLCFFELPKQKMSLQGLKGQALGETIAKILT